MGAAAGKAGKVLPALVMSELSPAPILQLQERNSEHERNGIDLRTLDAGVIAQMNWAKSFILILPMPICLIDKRGFIHHSNEEFDSIVSIDLGQHHRPHGGQFLARSDLYRSSIERIRQSKEVLVITGVLYWNLDCLKVTEANMMYAWTLSGNSSSEAVVISARYFLDIRCACRIHQCVAKFFFSEK